MWKITKIVRVGVTLVPVKVEVRGMSLKTDHYLICINTEKNVWSGLDVFYGMSTIVGYLMQNTLYIYYKYMMYTSVFSR